MTLVTFAAFLSQGCLQNKWWSLGYVESLAIPFTLLPVFGWIMFVPTYLEFTEQALIVQFRSRGLRKLAWSDLLSRGKGNGVYMLQFGGSAALQIAQATMDSPDRLCGIQVSRSKSRRFRRPVRLQVGPMTIDRVVFEGRFRF